MPEMKIGILLAAAFVLGACADAKNEILSPMPNAVISSDVRVVEQSVNVSRDLTVSEANYYYPIADINWREDPPGDRHAQVKAIITRASRWGLGAFDSGRNVRVEIDVLRFHALSEKARRDTGGIHSMRFIVTVYDARSEEVLHGPARVVGDLQAFGRSEAKTAVTGGLTQKSRIVQHIAGTLQQHLIVAGFGTLTSDTASDGS